MLRCCYLSSVLCTCSVFWKSGWSSLLQYGHDLRASHACPVYFGREFVLWSLRSSRDGLKTVACMRFSCKKACSTRFRGLASGRQASCREICGHRFTYVVVHLAQLALPVISLMIIKYHWYWTFEFGPDDYHDTSGLMRNTRTPGTVGFNLDTRHLDPNCEKALWAERAALSTHHVPNFWVQAFPLRVLQCELVCIYLRNTIKQIINFISRFIALLQKSEKLEISSNGNRVASGLAISCGMQVQY